MSRWCWESAGDGGDGEEEWDRSSHLELRVRSIFHGLRILYCNATRRIINSQRLAHGVPGSLSAASWTEKDAGPRKDTDLLRMATWASRLR